MRFKPIRALTQKTSQIEPSALSRSNFVYIDISSVDRNLKQIVSPQRLSTWEAPSRARKLIQTNDVLVSTVRPNLNAVALINDDYDGEIASTGFCVLRSKGDSLDPKYLFYLTQSWQFIHHLTEIADGANYPAVSDDDVLDFEIRVPDPLEQNRVATILADVDGERRRRRYMQSAQCDRFTQDLFVQMFGDPATNSMGWETVKLTGLGTLDRGRSKHRPRNDPHLLGGDYPLIQTGDVAGADRYIREYRQTYSAMGLRQSKLWPSGTLCITIAANIARTAILTFDSCFPDSVVGFAPYRITDSEYVLQWFTFVQKHLESIAPESAQKNINLEILRDLMLPLPPQDLRDAFATRIEEYIAVQAKQREAERQTDHLFQTLLDRAFRGEL